MDLQGFEINGVEIKTPQALSVATIVEKQSVTLLNGKRKYRVKRIYRTATLSYSMLEQDAAIILLNQTLKRAIDTGDLEVTIKYLDEFGVMSAMTATFSDFGFRAVSESIMNNRWAEIDDIVFTEV